MKREENTHTEKKIQTKLINCQSKAIEKPKNKIKKDKNEVFNSKSTLMNFGFKKEEILTKPELKLEPHPKEVIPFYKK